MSTALENLNLEEGKSEALRAALACVVESSAADGGPRYSEKVCRELARIIVCRSYAKPILELSHLLIAASADGRRYEDIFWGISRANASEFRRCFAELAGSSSRIRVSTDGVSHYDGADNFHITYTRMPLLAALLEFMIMTVGYPAIDDMTGSLRESDADADHVLDTARALQRAVYAYLKENLPPVQRQRRERHFLVYVEKHAGNRTGADAINDDVLLRYWQAYAASDEIEARTYRVVFDTARKLVVALDAAESRLSGTRAKPVGTDFEAGEVDPADLGAVFDALDDDEGPLVRLVDTCGEHAKFVNLSEAETLSELPLGEGTARRIPVSVLRNAVFGAVQLRISTALRRDEVPATALPGATDGFYLQKLNEYADVISMTEKLALAALWALHQAERVEAAELALALAPDIDWGQLMPASDDHAGNVVPLSAVDALRQFFMHQPDARGDEIPALLADAKRAWRGVNRTGFHDDSDPDSLDVLAAAAPAVLRLITAVRRTLDRDLATTDWPIYEANDAGVFAAMFANLYDLDEEAESHAG
jgi:hypothetical protein